MKSFGRELHFSSPSWGHGFKECLPPPRSTPAPVSLSTQPHTRHSPSEDTVTFPQRRHPSFSRPPPNFMSGFLRLIGFPVAVSLRGAFFLSPWFWALGPESPTFLLWARRRWELRGKEKSLSSERKEPSTPSTRTSDAALSSRNREEAPSRGHITPLHPQWR